MISNKHTLCVDATDIETQTQVRSFDGGAAQIVAVVVVTLHSTMI